MVGPLALPHQLSVASTDSARLEVPHAHVVARQVVVIGRQRAGVARAGAHHDAESLLEDRAVGDRGGPVLLDCNAGGEAENPDIGGRERATFVRDAGPGVKRAAGDCKAGHRDGDPTRDRDLVTAGEEVGRGLDRGVSCSRTGERQTLGDGDLLDVGPRRDMDGSARGDGRDARLYRAEGVVADGVRAPADR